MEKRGCALPLVQNDNFQTPAIAPKCIAIMQPTFLPWIGYLAMIDRVDIFVFLDNVQFEKRSWQQRNQIKSVNGPMWLTVPVKSKGLQDQKIQDVVVSNDEGDLYKKLYKSLLCAYKKASFFDEYDSGIKSIFEKNHKSLADLNIELIEWICRETAIETKMMRSSNLRAKGDKSELLANICSELEAKIYVSAPGSKKYIDESTSFKERSIDVLYHSYNHPVYAQLGKNFIPYMSSIDLLFNKGKNCLDVIREGVCS